MSFARKYGSRQDVFELGTAQMTRGGLTKADLMLSRSGKIVSVKKSQQAKTNYTKFGFSKRVVEEEKEDEETKKKPKRRRKRKKTVTIEEEE